MLQGTDGRHDPISTINVLSEREYAVVLTYTVFSSCTRTQSAVSYADIRLFCALILLESCSRYVTMSCSRIRFFFLYTDTQTQHTCFFSVCSLVHSDCTGVRVYVHACVLPCGFRCLLNLIELCWHLVAHLNMIYKEAN